jgi:glycosyltransferase involved in cell wall biosynthesis
MNNLLSINIPTFNRAVFLDENLKKMISLCDKHSVAIYVSDNNSSDNTYDIVKKHQKSYKYLFYRCLEKNMGIDLNMDSVVKMSVAKFSWLFSDDDLIDDDSIEIILNNIKNKNPDFILLNHREKDLKTKKLLLEKYVNIDDKDHIINDKTLLSLYAHQMTLLSACVVKTENWKKINFSSYKAKFYFHIHNIFFNLNPDSRIVFIGKPLFTKFNGNYWQFDVKELDAVLHFHYPRTINDLSNHYKIESKISAIKPKIDKISIGTFIRLRSGGYISLTYIPKVFFYFIRFRIILVFVFLFLPKSFSGLVYMLFNKYVR